MTTTQASFKSMSKITHEVLIDNLRSCHSHDEMLAFEKWFNSNTNEGPLYVIICDFLRNRSISRGLAAKWLNLLISNREKQLKQ